MRTAVEVEVEERMEMGTGTANSDRNNYSVDHRTKNRPMIELPIQVLDHPLLRYMATVVVEQVVAPRHPNKHSEEDQVGT